MTVRNIAYILYYRARIGKRVMETRAKVKFGLLLGDMLLHVMITWFNILMIKPKCSVE